MTNEIDKTADRDHRIRRRAYELWEAAGRPEGEEHAHWYQACSEVDGEAGRPVAVAGGDGPDAAPLETAAAPLEAAAALKGRARPPLPGKAQRSATALAK